MTAKLVCPECRRENEGERIYCHDCGAKLDRSKVIAPKASDERSKERRRLRIMFDAKRAKMRLLFFKLAKTILGACGAALLVLMVLPADVPPPQKEALALSQIGLEVENAITTHRTAPLQYSEDQINDYLSNATKSKRKALNKPFLNFERAIAHFSEGKCTITAERSVFGYSLFTTTSQAVQISEGKIKATNKGGAIGRLEVYPQIMEYLDIAFADLWSALDRERKLLSKASAIEFHDKAVVLTMASAPPQ